MATSITLVTNSSSSEYTLATGGRGPAGPPGTAGVIVDASVIDGSANAVSGNAVFDALALKAPLASPTFSGIVTAPRIEGKCAGLELFSKAGQAINAGQVVYVTGASGNNIVIGLARANAEETSSKTIGISESTLANNATGYVITEGLMTVSISAPTANEGDPIWLSPATAGSMVFGLANKPSAPNHIVYLGVVTRKTGSTVVEIYVKIQNGAELDELSDVSITSPVAGQALMRGASLWGNRALVSNDISDSSTGGNGTADAGKLVEFNPTGGVSAKHIRLHGDTYYTQINPTTIGQTQDIAFNLPTSSGTIASDKTALMLTGGQTAAGPKTFSGQMELTGQAATNATSVITRSLGDSRYESKSYVAIKVESVESFDITPIKLASVTLPVGTYFIDSNIAATAANITNGGLLFGLRANFPIRTSLTSYVSRDSDITYMSPVASDSIQLSTQFVLGTTGRRNLTGIIEIITNNTEVSIEFCQNSTFPSLASITRKRAYIIARKIA